jgi:hypothetical protein
MIELVCPRCGVQYFKTVSEYNRNQRKNRTSYCGYKCAGKENHAHLRQYKNSSNLIPANHRDEYTQFRWFLARTKQRKYDCDIDLQYLKDLWIHQNGRCALSGIPLELPVSTAGFTQQHHPWNASLDRIDSNKGYIKNNVRYVAFIANIAKNVWDDSVLLTFAKELLQHNIQNIVT